MKMQFAIRRGVDGGRTERTRTDKAKDEVKLSKVGGYAFVDADRDTLAEDIAEIKTGKYDEIVVPIAHSPIVPTPDMPKVFIRAILDLEATLALDGRLGIALKSEDGRKYITRPDGSRDTIIKRIA